MSGFGSVAKFAPAEGGHAANEIYLPLPIYPTLWSFVRNLLYYVFVALLINAFFSVVAVSFYAGSYGSAIKHSLCAVLSGGGDCEKQPFLIFFAIVALAQISSMIWPTHWVHDEAVRFFHRAELCDRLAREIDSTGYVDPASVQDRRNWAANVVREYRWARRFAKGTLFIVNILVAAAILVPWGWVLAELNFQTPVLLIVTALMVPTALDICTEMFSLIWPGKQSQLLL